jgi:hypothetical protein
MATTTITLAYLSIAASLAAGGVAAYSSYQQGKAADDQAQYNAQAERINQRSTQKQADADVQRIREKYRRVKAGQQASAAANGLFSSGSFGDLSFDTNLQEDLDVLSTLYKSKVQITGSDQRRSLGLMQGAAGRQAGNMGAVGAGLSGIGDAYAAYPATRPSTTTYPTVAN